MAIQTRVLQVEIRYQVLTVNDECFRSREGNGNVRIVQKLEKSFLGGRRTHRSKLSSNFKLSTQNHGINAHYHKNKQLAKSKLKNMIMLSVLCRRSPTAITASGQKIYRLAQRAAAIKV